jgi:hypothetical protein
LPIDDPRRAGIASRLNARDDVAEIDRMFTMFGNLVLIVVSDRGTVRSPS